MIFKFLLLNFGKQDKTKLLAKLSVILIRLMLLISKSHFHVFFAYCKLCTITNFKDRAVYCMVALSCL